MDKGPSGLYGCLMLLLIASTAAGEGAVPSYIYHIFPGPDPHYRVAPTDQIVTAGDKFAIFHCLPAGADDVKVEWKIFSPDGEAIVGDRHHVSNDGTRLKILEPMEFYDNFEIHCYLFSAFRSEPLKATAKLFVRPPKHPKIVVTPRSGKYKSGSRVVLECAAHGWPLPKIAWTFVSRRHRTEHFFEVDREYRDFIKEPNRLIILSMSPDTEGSYACVAHNRQGHDRSSAQVGLDRRAVRRPNVQKMVHNMRSVYETLHRYSRHSEQRLSGKATCLMEALGQFGHTEHSTRQLDSTTMAYDYALAQLEQLQHDQLHSLPGEALNIDFKLLQYFKSNLNCSGNRVPEPDCRRFADFLMRYTSPDGSCNHYKHPTWGQAGRGFARALQSQYELGLNLPQGYQPSRKYGGFHKPSARKVSLHVLLAKEYPVDHAVSQMFNFFGQFIDHDLDQTPGASTDRGLRYEADCNKHCKIDLPCFPIIAPRDDPRVKGCLSFKRSAAFCASGEFSDHKSCIRPREQINQLTSTLDASVVYGSSCQVLNLLRDFSAPGIYLKSGPPVKDHLLRLLPTGIEGLPTACGRNRDSPNTKCYNAGEVRSNEFVMLTVQHTMMMREHNRIAHVLHTLNPQWCPDKVFYETRRIVAAVLQQMTYSEYLPLLIGNTGMRKLVGPYKGFRPGVNPTVFNEFAACAFRIGHSMLPNFMAMLDKNFKLLEALSLKSALFAPHLIAKYDIDPLLRGAITVAMKSRSKGAGTMSDSIVNQLFEKTATLAGDLAALNIQRGRDHGLPAYNYWRVLCGLRWASKWEHLSAEIRDPHALQKLKEVYGSPLNVDLFPAMVLEDRVDDALVGPTARCLVAMQFRAVRDGDRYWFENPGQFSQGQVQEIREYTYSRLICNTVETINHIQPHAFFIPRQHSDLVHCSTLPDMDLNAWRDADPRTKCTPQSPCAPQPSEPGSAPDDYRQQ